MSMDAQKQTILNSESGYTLITTAICIMVVGFLVASLSSLYLMYDRKVDLVDTREGISDIREALDRYIAINGRLPCPAPLDAETDSDTYAVSVAASCDGMATYSGVSRVYGRAGGLSAGVPVYIGAVPTRTLNLPDSAMLDGYSKRIVYAVTASYTTAAADFSKNEGAITLQDGLDGSGDPNHVTATADSAIYLLISHGADSRGAYSVSGQELEPCGDDGSNFTTENCDRNDAIFNLSMNRSYDIDSGRSYTSTFHYKANGRALYKWKTRNGPCLCSLTHDGQQYVKVKETFVECFDSDDVLVADGFCLSSRPSDEPVDCSSERADCFNWRESWSSWGSCSASCEGSRSRVSSWSCHFNADGLTDLAPQPDGELHCIREGKEQPAANSENQSCGGACPREEGGSGGGGGGSSSSGGDQYVDTDGDGRRDTPVNSVPPGQPTYGPPGVQNNFGGSSSSSGSSSGGGGYSCMIVTHLYRRKLFGKREWLINKKDALSGRLSMSTLHGYHVWAPYVVVAMRKSSLIEWIVFKLFSARNRTLEVEQGRCEKVSMFDYVARAILEYPSIIIGQLGFKPNHDFNYGRIYETREDHALIKSGYYPRQPQGMIGW